MLKLTAAHVEGLQTTTRWHTRALPPQTLADHSCAVALLAGIIAGDTVPPEESGELLGICLLHDLHETQFGDLPFPAKRHLKEAGLDLDEHFRGRFWGPVDPYDAAAPHIRHLVDVADVIEAALYARRHGDAVLADTCRLQAVRSIHDHLTGACAARALQVLGEVES